MRATDRIQLGEDVDEVEAYAVLRDEKPLADLRVGQPLAHELDDLALALSELLLDVRHARMIRGEADMDRRLGIEPRFRESKSRVLPLDDPRGTSRRG